MPRCEPGCGEMGSCHPNLADEVEALAAEAYRAALVLRGLASAGFNDSRASRRTCQNLARALARAIAKAGGDPPPGLVKPRGKQEVPK